MTEDQRMEAEAQRRVQVTQPAKRVRAEIVSESPPAPDHAPPYTINLLGNSKLRGRGNGPVEISMIQRLQQTHSNRAVRRYLQRSSALAPPGTGEISVSEQSDGFDQKAKRVGEAVAAEPSNPLAT